MKIYYCLQRARRTFGVFYLGHFVPLQILCKKLRVKIKISILKRFFFLILKQQISLKVCQVTSKPI